jgi:hypothetical protein
MNFLVSFDRAGGFDEKTFHYQRMLRSRRHAEARPIEKGIPPSPAIKASGTLLGEGRDSR